MNKFKGYMIISDLDGTFLGKHARIVERNVEAIERFKAEGGLFTFATGRAHYNARVAIPNIEDYVNTSVICANGTYLYDAAGDRLEQVSFLDSKKALEAVKYSFEKYPDFFLRMTGTDGFYIVEENYVEKNMFSKLDPKFIHLLPIAEWPDEWIKCVFLGTPERIKEFKEDITYRFPEFEYALSSPRLYEFQCKGVTKGTALRDFKKRLEAQYGYPITVYAAGDYGNDIDMLRCADVAIAPSNAIDEVKAEVDHVLCHHDEGLIVDIIELIESKL